MTDMGKDKVIGFGLIGAGMIANYHARAIAGLAAEGCKVRLAGVADLSLQSAERLAEEHHIPFFTDDVEALLARDDVDVVCIVTPSGAHLEPALQAIAAGKHLVIEKPLEVTVERVNRLLDAADQAGVLVAAIFQGRFGMAARTIKKAIDDGRFGRLVLCSAYVKWHRAADYYKGWKGSLALDGGGAVMNQAIHAVDLLQWLAGMPAEVSAFTTRRVHLQIEAEDTCCATFRYQNGALGTLEATTAAYPGWERRVEICGAFGSAALEDDRIVRWDFQDPLPDDATILSDNRTGAGSGAGAPDQISHEGHQKQLREVVDALTGQKPLSVTGREALKTVALVRAIYASAEQNSPVQLNNL
ncbi:Gfo/Idh/MocA family oxidoreductase [uncultured Martelella sp.]|uniref:Gfo/Idh/MocA family protein n=1 Tax=uncultured Martelella sp. TaxID=392331 RepID=UPI0029C93471|nr:Gfo/Idh/MocA family oxidoreductase [uncultured Martelella sp.]